MRGRANATGFTLLEVVLALAILAGAAATLSQLVGVGLKAAAQARDATEAHLLAESVMSEITAGITAPQGMANVALPSNPDWSVTVNVQPTQQSGVLQIDLTVTKSQAGSSRRAMPYTLSRWMRDPSLAYAEDTAATQAANAASTSSTSSNSTTGNTSSTNSNTNNTNTNNGNNGGGNGGGANIGGATNTGGTANRGTGGRTGP